MKAKTSISNIAWPKERDADALSFVADLGFDGVELAPMKVFGPLTELSTSTVQRYRDELASRGFYFKIRLNHSCVYNTGHDRNRYQEGEFYIS